MAPLSEEKSNELSILVATGSRNFNTWSVLNLRNLGTKVLLRHS